METIVAIFIIIALVACVIINGEVVFKTEINTEKKAENLQLRIYLQFAIFAILCWLFNSVIKPDESLVSLFRFFRDIWGVSIFIRFIYVDYKARKLKEEEDLSNEDI